MKSPDAMENGDASAGGAKSVTLTAAPFDYLNLALVLLAYVALYSTLAGLFALMLKGVIATSAQGGGDVLLWAFFVAGVLFGAAVCLTVHLSQRQEAERKKLDDAPEGGPATRSSFSRSSFSYLMRLKRSFSGDDAEGDAAEAKMGPNTHKAPAIDNQLKDLLNKRRQQVEGDKKDALESV